MSSWTSTIDNPRRRGHQLDLPRHWATLAAMLAVLLALTACASGAVSDRPDASGEAGSGATANQPVAQVEVVPGSAAAGGAPQVDLDGLSADAVVAAQEQVINGVYEAVLPSVVQVRSTRNMADSGTSPRLPDIPGFPFDQGPDLPEDFFERSAGSGFVWDDQGHIITNHHVVANAERVTVMFPDRTEYEAEVLGSDPDSDLAVLQISDPEGLPPAVALGDSNQVRVGQMAMAIGNPFGQEFTITSGIISAVGRTIRSGNSEFSIPEVIQTDAPINPGNSGGPLLNRMGQVIGVNTQIISRSGSSSGIGFAVPINIARQVVPALLNEGSFDYAWLGISGTSVTPDIAERMDLPRNTHGALIIDLIEDGPAEEFGLKGSDRTAKVDGADVPLGGDIIVAIDGVPVETIDDLIAYLVSNTRPDQEVTLELIRENGEREEVKVTLGRRPGSV